MTTFSTLEAARASDAGGADVIRIIEIECADGATRYIRSKGMMAALDRSLAARPMPEIVRLVAEYETTIGREQARVGLVANLAAERNAMRRHDAVYNEGGEGYNPHGSYADADNTPRYKGDEIE